MRYVQNICYFDVVLFGFSWILYSSLHTQARTKRREYTSTKPILSHRITATNHICLLLVLNMLYNISHSKSFINFKFGIYAKIASLFHGHQACPYVIWSIRQRCFCCDRNTNSLDILKKEPSAKIQSCYSRNLISPFSFLRSFARMYVCVCGASVQKWREC